MESKMQRNVVIAEYCIMFCLCSTTLILRLLINRHKSVQSMWKLCPVVCVLLLLVIPMALLDLLMSVLWNAVILGAIDNEPHNACLLATSVIVIAFDYVYCCVTLSIFLQRIFYMLLPTRNITKFNLVVFPLLGAAAVGCGIATFLLILSNVSFEEQPLPPGCFSFNCLATTNPSVQIVPSTVTAVFSGMIVVAGTFMLALVYRHRKRCQNTSNAKISTFTLYIFYLRLVFETIPFVVDVVLSKTTDIQLGKYLGSYGALGSVLDTTVTTAVYYRLYRGTKQNAIASSRTR